MKKGRYVLRNRGKSTYNHLVISPELHILIKDYAERNKTTMIDAAYTVITAGLIQVEGMEVSEKPGTLDYIVSKEVAKQLKEKHS